MATTEKWLEAADYETDVVVDVPVRERAQRIQISCGTKAAPEVDYGAGARIPAGPWRESSARDRYVVFNGDSPARAGQMVRLVTPPPHIFAGFEGLRKAAAAGGLAGARGSVSSHRFVETIRQFADCARDVYGLGISCDEEIPGGIRVNAAGLQTVTTHSKQGHFVGMHVDNWSMALLKNRHTAPIRICLNIGSEPRFFLFVGLTIQAIAEKVRSAPGFHTTLGCTDIGRLFLSNCPAYAVLRLQVMPGEAYIAPTEAIIHDGSTESARLPDLSLSVRENNGPGESRTNRQLSSVAHRFNNR
jgi:hypothetical protein